MSHLSTYLMIKFARTLVAAAAFVAASASSASAQFTVYNSRTSFEAALSSFYVDNFNNDAISTPGASVVTDAGSFGSGMWNDRVAPSGSTTIWSFLGGATAFGGEWDLTPGGAGTGIHFSVNWLNGGSAAVGGEIDRSYSGQFYGFIATSAFSDVIVSAGTQQGNAETHAFDNMTTSSVVPEPSTYALMTLGLGIVGFAARRRKVAKA